MGKHGGAGFYGRSEYVRQQARVTNNKRHRDEHAPSVSMAESGGTAALSRQTEFLRQQVRYNSDSGGLPRFNNDGVNGDEPKYRHRHRDTTIY